jgi:hypothetical protein
MTLRPVPAVVAALLILTSLIVSCAGCSCTTQGNKDNDSAISVMTDKSVYLQGEVVKVTLTNKTDECIRSHIRSLMPVFSIEYVEKKESSNTWEKLYAQCQPPHCEYDIDAPGTIEAGEVVSFEWHPLIYIGGGPETEQLAMGTYRLSITYQDCLKTDWISVRSNEFTIEQK